MILEILQRLEKDHCQDGMLKSDISQIKDFMLNSVEQILNNLLQHNEHLSSKVVIDVFEIGQILRELHYIRTGKEEEMGQ